MITRIKQIRSLGVFRDFAWPHDLPEFARYNLIYGWNGSGKTTLSRILRAMELREQLQDGEVALATDSGDISGTDFSNVNIPIRVFNRDFMTENVFPTSGTNVPLILVVGKESVEKQKEVEKLREDRNVAESALASVQTRKQDAERAIDNFCIDEARVIKDILRSPGTNKYNNYDKSDFRTRAKQFVSENDADSFVLDDPERDKALAQHRATPKDKITVVSYRLPILDPFASAVTELLQVTVVSQTIKALREDPVLSEWTRQGLGIHRDRNAGRCLFCEQSLPSGRLSAIEAHFSTEYDRFLLRLSEQTDSLRAALRQISELKMPNKGELYEDLATDYGRCRSALQQTLDTVKQYLETLVIALENKKEHPFDSLEHDVSMPEINVTGVEKLSEIIQRHNHACDEFDKRCSTARDRLALSMIASYVKEYKHLSESTTVESSNERLAATKVNELTSQIDRIEREIVEHRRPVEELNEDLLRYLGHGELKLQVLENGYSIARNGIIAKVLSEGEMTAIALLYFLKSLQDRRFDLRTGLIVLDDPVSSLDANALYMAFGFIQERTKDAEQLVILTHNFTFFRQVRNWFHHLKNQNKKDISRRPARFYMIECAHNLAGRQATIRLLDPLLERFDSEYHFLFDRIYRVANNNSKSCLEENYTLVNIARRFLEAFLAFRQPHISGEIWQKLQAINYDEAKKIRILRFLHTYSHNSAIADPEHDPSELGEAQAILNDLLDLVKSEDSKHFAAMEQVVNPTSDGDSER